MLGDHIYAHQVARKNFILLHGELPVGQARKRMQRARTTGADYAIVQCDRPTRAYYLLGFGAVELSLRHCADESESVQLALALKQQKPAALIDAYATDYENMFGVVMDEGYPIGYTLVAADPFLISGYAAPDPLEMTEVVEVAASMAAAVDEAPPEPRSLLAEMEMIVPLNQTTELTVHLSAPGVTAVGALPIVADAGSAIEVLIRPMDSAFSVVDGADMKTLSVPDDGSLAALTFALKAEEVGVGKVRVFAFQDGLPLGHLTVVAEVVAANESPSGARESATMELEPTSVSAPDLSMIVMEQKQGDETEITIMLNASDPELGLNYRRFSSKRLRTDPQAYFQEFFKDIERLPLETERDHKRARRRLHAKGYQLFETLFPRDLQELLWMLRDRIEEVQIQSDEPWIPWELCKLQGVESGEIVEGPFLCEAFAITRWITDIRLQPRLSLNQIALVVPGDSGLSYSKEESAFLKSLASEQRVVEEIPAYYDDVLDALSLGTYDGLHFSGHGVFRATDPNHSGMELEDGDRLVPEDLGGPVRNLGKARPLVFLNACQLGRSAMSLTDVGGWAPRFLNAGAGAFIGAYWSVYDDSAYAFAEMLYTRLLDGEPMGKAVRAARLAARDGGDPSWLAYTVFAHPDAVVCGQAA